MLFESECDLSFGHLHHSDLTPAHLVEENPTVGISELHVDGEAGQTISLHLNVFQVTYSLNILDGVKDE